MQAFDENYLEQTLRTAFDDPLSYKLPKGVTRYDYANTHGWWVRVTRERVKFRQLFSDGVCGSIENALRLALLYRHELLSSFPMATIAVNKRILPANPRDRISRVVEPGIAQPYISWVARWYDSERNTKTKQFSVLKFGEEGARANALEAATKNHHLVKKEWAVQDPYEHDQWRVISREDVEVLASISSNAYGNGSKFSEDISASSPFGYEGERRAKIHISIERDKALRARKLEEFLSSNGRLRCELCSFNFKDAFKFLSRDIIEVHHKLPLASLSSSTRVETRDLMLLCSNCHTAIHQGDAVANLEAAVKQFALGTGWRNDA